MITITLDSPEDAKILRLALQTKLAGLNAVARPMRRTGAQTNIYDDGLKNQIRVLESAIAQLA